MMIEIKSRWTGAILFAIETDTWRLAVEASQQRQAVVGGAYVSSTPASA